MLHFANVYLFIYFLWPPYAPALVNGDSRKFYTWWTLNVNREVTTWIFSWSSLNYRVDQKVTKFGTIFTPRPQTFCSHARTQQNIVILKKLVKHRWVYTCAAFRKLWRTNPWDPRAMLLFLKTNRLGHVLFPFARWQYDHAQTALYIRQTWTRTADAYADFVYSADSV